MISYPLYTTHYFGIWWFGNYFVSKNPPAEYLPWIIGIGTLLMVFFAFLVMKFYEMPLRNFLSQKRKEMLLRRN